MILNKESKGGKAIAIDRSVPCSHLREAGASNLNSSKKGKIEFFFPFFLIFFFPKVGFWAVIH